ncbi:MAG: RNA 3'-terminal phosphate cyclase [Acidobacteriota bacterium]
MLQIDGSFGEGGGQILRSSLTLSLVTGKPFRIDGIRARRRKPGLLRQHLTALRAAAAVSAARVEGGHLGSTALRFEPGPVTPGDFHFAVGTAGSTVLVLQTVLPALLTASAPSTLVLEGGTHNPMAPPFPFLADTYLPLLRRLGPGIEARLERPGFFPAGGGLMRVGVEPRGPLAGFDLHRRGDVVSHRATAYLSHLREGIGRRELRTVQKLTGWADDACRIVSLEGSPGPGNLLVLQLTFDDLTETFCGFGRHGVRAESVASGAVKEMRRFLAAEVPVGEYLADQWLLPLALAGRGSFTSLPLSRHASTQVKLIQQFLDMGIRVERNGADQDVVTVGAP